jgi:hypothetical protein
MRETAMGVIRLVLLVEAASFGVASCIHFGRLIQGYEHPQALIAEAVIAIASSRLPSESVPGRRPTSYTTSVS